MKQDTVMYFSLRFKIISLEKYIKNTVYINTIIIKIESRFFVLHNIKIIQIKSFHWWENENQIFTTITILRVFPFWMLH